jgi:hypothetical protein
MGVSPDQVDAAPWPQVDILCIIQKIERMQQPGGGSLCHKAGF